MGLKGKAEDRIVWFIIAVSGLDLESVMALQTDLTSDEELSTTIDLSDAQAIRKQLDGLENMYTEVLKLLGEKNTCNTEHYSLYTLKWFYLSPNKIHA